jgi:Gas vesicle synthesis protein GvpL/GvpF
VKAFAGAPVTVPADDPSPASGTAYLTLKRDRREAADEERQAAETAVASLHAQLAERAAAATVSAPQDRRLSGHDAEMLLNAAYLVPTDGADAFRALVEQLRREHETQGLAIELTGPWPPYHFVDPLTHDRDQG